MDLADLDAGAQFPEMYEKQAPTNFIFSFQQKKEMEKETKEKK